MPAEGKGEEGKEEVGDQDHIAHSAVEIKVFNIFQSKALHWLYLG